MNELQVLWLEVEDEGESGKNLYYIFVVLFKLTDVSPPQWLKRAHVTLGTWVRAPVVPFCLFFSSCFHLFLFEHRRWASPLWALFCLLIPDSLLAHTPLAQFLFILFISLFFLYFLYLYFYCDYVGS